MRAIVTSSCFCCVILKTFAKKRQYKRTVNCQTSHDPLSCCRVPSTTGLPSLELQTTRHTNTNGRRGQFVLGHIPILNCRGSGLCSCCIFQCTQGQKATQPSISGNHRRVLLEHVGNHLHRTNAPTCETNHPSTLMTSAGILGLKMPHIIL